MIALFVLLIVAVVALVGAVAVGWGGSMPEPTSDGKPFGLPDAALSSADLDGLRFAVVARGYRMDQVDAVLDRISAELAEREARITELESGPAAVPGGSPGAETGGASPWQS